MKKKNHDTILDDFQVKRAKKPASKSIALIYICSAYDHEDFTFELMTELTKDFSLSELKTEIFGNTCVREFENFIFQKILSDGHVFKDFVKNYILRLQDKSLKKYLLEGYYELLDSKNTPKEEVEKETVN